LTCRDAEARIIPYAAGAAIPPQVATHIAGCEHCRRLARAIQETQPDVPPSPERLKQIEAGILADLKPVKPLVPGGVLFLAVMCVVVVVAALGSAELGNAGWRALSLLQRIAVFTALATATCLLAVSVGRQIVPGSALLLSPYLLVIAVLGVMTGIVATLFHPLQESTFVPTGLVCLRIGIECAIGAAFLLWLLLRRGAILHPMLTGATTGALAGLSGLTVLEIFCPNLNEYHILVWHLGAALTSSVGGVAIGSLAEYFGGRRAHPIR
jgi:hypothetical protein